MRSKHNSCICSIFFFKINGKDAINVYSTRKNDSCLCWLCPEELMNSEAWVENKDRQCLVLFLFLWIFTYSISDSLFIHCTFNVKQHQSLINRGKISFPVPRFWWQSYTEHTEFTIMNTLSMQVVSKFLGEYRVPCILLNELNIFQPIICMKSIPLNKQSIIVLFKLHSFT